jgi:branched-chain amino acid aminotransferase
VYNDPVTQAIYFVNDAFLPASQAMLPVSDLSVMRGYGVFDFLITYNHKPFRLDDHLRRLKKSLELIDLTPPKPLAEIKKLILETLDKNRSPKEKAIRIVVTGGESLAPDFVRPVGKAGLVITVDPKHEYPPECYTHGIKVITFPHCRPNPQAKTLNYITAIQAQKQAKAVGAIEAIYVCNHQLMEGTTTNFFAIIRDTLVTPRQGILLGITRNVVLELAKNLVKIDERSINREELATIDEAFITSSNKEVMPVVQIDQQRVGRGKTVEPGPVTRKIMDAFKRYTQTVSH